MWQQREGSIYNIVTSIKNVLEKCANIVKVLMAFNIFYQSDKVLNEIVKKHKTSTLEIQNFLIGNNL